MREVRKRDENEVSGHTLSVRIIFCQEVKLRKKPNRYLNHLIMRISKEIPYFLE